ncbi:MAG: RNA polymerase sigma factor [Nocardioidaceae bacterium]|nr:RNA polymerase sigma factor [Nocardioidaceae bacterium]
MDESSTDGELLAAVADGSAVALEVLYRRHASWLVVRLARRCADPAVVDEVIQDTFVSVWKSAGRYTGQGDVAAWVWAIAIHRLVDAFRRRPPAAYPLDEFAPQLTTLESAEDRVLLGIEHGDLAGALGRLSPELRTVVQATVLDGLTTREAARLLGLPAGTVKTRMMRARRALRKELA